MDPSTSPNQEPRPASGREEQLEQLFGSLFATPEDLRIHLAHEPDGFDLSNNLPGPAATRSTLDYSAVQQLKSRGAIDRAFFDRLVAARPRRALEIRRVRGRWLHGAALDRDELWADGRYRLIEQLGAGGVGVVWKALDTQTDTFVALKILLDSHSNDPELRKRFLRGTQVLADLDHPAIVRVHSGVEQEGLRFFYVMEFVDGEPLGTLVTRLPPEDGHGARKNLLDCVFQVGDALAYLHARGLVHRDVKPGNILVSPNGRAKLIDFDLVTGDAFVSITEHLVGTALFTPPEALTPTQKTPAYDVYGLARTAECVLLGRLPTGDEAGDMGAGNGLSDRVRAVLGAALHPRPIERTTTVETFCRDLRTALDAHNLPQPDPPQPPAPPKDPLSPLIVVLAALMGIAAVSLAIYMQRIEISGPGLTTDAQGATISDDATSGGSTSGDPTGPGSTSGTTSATDATTGGPSPAPNLLAMAKQKLDKRWPRIVTACRTGANCTFLGDSTTERIEFLITFSPQKPKATLVRQRTSRCLTQDQDVTDCYVQRALSAVSEFRSDPELVLKYVNTIN